MGNKRFHTEALNPYVIENGALGIQTGLGTLPSIKESDQFAFAQGWAERFWFIPYSKQVGDHKRTGEFEPNRKYSLRVLYYRGLVPNTEPNAEEGYYLAGNHSRNPYWGNGETSYSQSIAFEGIDNVYQRDWKRWYEFMKFGRYATMEVLLSLVHQLKVNLLSWVWIRNMRFLIKKMVTALPFEQRVKVEAIQKASDNLRLFLLPQTVCIDAAAFILEPFMEGGVWTGPNVILFGDDYYFDPGVMGVGVSDVTYTVGNLSWTQEIEVKDLPTVTLDPFDDVHVTDPPFALSGGSPAGGFYTVDDIITVTFDPAAHGLGTFVIKYFYADAFSCSSFDQENLTVIP